jgi:hypothetical protein
MIKRADSASHAATVVMHVALATVVVALVALAGWQYLMPAAFKSVWGLNHAGVAHFRDAYGVHAAPVGTDTFGWAFRALLWAAWVAYLALAVAGAAGGRLSPRTLRLVTATLAVTVALVWPLSLSLDTYRYVGYGRLAAVHHVNPYAAGRELLAAVNDPTAPFMAEDLPSPYGPLWTWLSIAVVWPLAGAGLYAQVLAFKLLAAAALIVTARAGAALAERMAPGRGELTLAAIGCNPLFVIEGPGNGHNDLVMMALVMTALAAHAGGRARVGAVLAGAAAAVKFIPLLLLPWLVVRASRSAWPPARRALASGAGVAAFAVLPLLVTYLPLWRGAATLAGLGEHMNRAQAGTVGPLLGSLLGLAAYAVTIGYVTLRPGIAPLVSVWVLAALTVLLTASGVWFPWYFAWPWTVLLTRWSRAHVGLSLALLLYTAFLTTMYSVWR